jgi:hypothetical protein
MSVINGERLPSESDGEAAGPVSYLLCFAHSLLAESKAVEPTALMRGTLLT